MKHNYSISRDSKTGEVIYLESDKNGYTVKDFDRDARRVAENLRTARSKNPYVSSDEIIDDEPLNSTLVSENNQMIERDELYD